MDSWNFTKTFRIKFYLMAAHIHNPVYANFAIAYSGQHQGSTDFSALYNIVVPFDITCAQCCVTYLIDTRGYLQIVGNCEPEYLSLII